MKAEVEPSEAPEEAKDRRRGADREEGAPICTRGECAEHTAPKEESDEPPRPDQALKEPAEVHQRPEVQEQMEQARVEEIGTAEPPPLARSDERWAVRA